MVMYHNFLPSLEVAEKKKKEEELASPRPVGFAAGKNSLKELCFLPN